MQEVSKNEYALITGASGGIGLELATIMASRGHNLILVARTREKLEDISRNLINHYGIDIKVFDKDLSLTNDRQQLIDALFEMNLMVNILVNNAGFGDSGNFHQSDWEKNERMIQLNITALTHLTRSFLPMMVSNRNGRILNVASIAGYLPGPLMSVYYASKAYVVSFSQALYYELKGTGVTVTTLSPGPVRTNFFNYAGAGEAKINSILEPATASSVAKLGYRKMMKGRRSAIQGWNNKLIVLGLRFMPKSLTSAITKKLHV